MKERPRFLRFPLCLSRFSCWLGLLILLAPFSSHAEWGVNFQTTYAQSSLYKGTYPYALVSRDFTGDGRVDLAVANDGADPASGQTAQGYVSILVNGGGSFTAVNDDGIPDLVVTNSGSDSISVFLGRGDGSFNARRDSPAAGSPLVIAASDFNRDGHLDLAVTALDGEKVSVLLGHGDGTFGPGTDISVDTDLSPGSAPSPSGSSRETMSRSATRPAPGSRSARPPGLPVDVPDWRIRMYRARCPSWASWSSSADCGRTGGTGATSRCSMPDNRRTRI